MSFLSSVISSFVSIFQVLAVIIDINPIVAKLSFVCFLTCW